MSAHYDTYDYPTYWEGRDYEHRSEIIAIKSFLDRIPKTDRLLEIGAGYGRLIPVYIYRAKRVIITDPSAKLLCLARRKFAGQKKIKIIQSTAENLGKKISSKSVDLIIVVRVLHHIQNLDHFFRLVYKLLKPGGYLILEFPNKVHLKATIREFASGNFTYPLEIFTKNFAEKKRKKKFIPFQNFHPDLIRHKLKESSFIIMEGRSVSNIRIPIIKKIIPVDFLLFLEKYLQKPLYFIGFGPSIFLLARKRGNNSKVLTTL